MRSFVVFVRDACAAWRESSSALDTAARRMGQPACDDVGWPALQRCHPAFYTMLSSRSAAEGSAFPSRSDAEGAGAFRPPEWTLWKGGFSPGWVEESPRLKPDSLRLGSVA